LPEAYQYYHFYEVSIIRHKPCVYDLLFNPLQLTHNPTPDFRRMALGCQPILRLPPVLEISL
jgi:hypothetical protein